MDRRVGSPRASQEVSPNDLSIVPLFRESVKIERVHKVACSGVWIPGPFDFDVFEGMYERYCDWGKVLRNITYLEIKNYHNFSFH